MHNLLLWLVHATRTL